MGAAGPADQAKSSATVAPALAPADGSATATITVTLRDASNAAVPGRTVTMASSRGAVDTITPASASSDQAGVASFSVKSLTSGSAVFTALSSVDGVSLSATVTFTISASTSTVTASPATVAADGASTSLITVTLRDGTGAGVAGKNVILTSNRSGSDTVLPVLGGTSNAAGVASFNVRSILAGTATLTATDATDNVTLTAQATVSFSASNAPSPVYSTITASTTSVAADGFSTATVTVTLRDASGVPSWGKTVTLLSSRGAVDSIAPASAVTNSRGIAPFLVSSSTGGTATFTATSVTDNVALSQAATVTFTGGQAASGTSTVSASIPSATVGGAAVAITVTVRDVNHLAQPGKTVTLTSSRGGVDTISPGSAVTDSSGVAYFYVSSMSAGTSSFTAFNNSDGVSISQTATVTFYGPGAEPGATGQVSPGESSVYASATSTRANGSAVTITVALRDADGQTPINRTVTLTSSRGGVDLVSPPSAFSGGSGSVSFSVSSYTTGTATFRAYVSPDEITLSQTAIISFTAGTGDTSGQTSAANSTVTAASGTVPADGLSAGRITVVLRDANHTPLAGKTVSVTGRSGLDTITPSFGTTDSEGYATFSIRSSAPGSSRITAYVTTDGVTLSQRPTVSFVSSGSTEAGVSTVTVSPLSVPANGTTITTVTVLLRDLSGNPMSGKTVILTSNRGSNESISPSSLTTGSDGVARFSVTSTMSGTAVFSARNVTDGLTLAQTATVTFEPARSASAPALVAPEDQAALTTLGTLLRWNVPSGTQWFQLKVAPFQDDGPGIDLVIGDAAQVAAGQYQIKEPEFGSAQPNYLMLPGMTYTWRVRTAVTSSTPSEPDWGPWSDARSFRTVAKSSTGITAMSPASGSTVVSSMTPTLNWANTDSSIYYYEVQVSRDPGFGQGQGAPLLYWELRHGGATWPPNSYTIPSAFPLEAGTQYHWRVRPRVQGNGTPAAWSSTFTFRTP